MTFACASAVWTIYAPTALYEIALQGHQFSPETAFLALCISVFPIIITACLPIPLYAAATRRLHDIGASGKLIGLAFAANILSTLWTVSSMTSKILNGIAETGPVRQGGFVFSESNVQMLLLSIEPINWATGLHSAILLGIIVCLLVKSSPDVGAPAQ
jgi:uncharacterized membrane protein YhaH (DUF805 family)